MEMGGGYSKKRLHKARYFRELPAIGKETAALGEGRARHGGQSPVPHDRQSVAILSPLTTMTSNFHRSVKKRWLNRPFKVRRPT
jgi:hypothetical protein